MRLLTAQPVFYIPDSASVISSAVSFTDIYRESSPVSSFSSSALELKLGYSFPVSSKSTARVYVSRTGYLASYQKRGDISSFKAGSAHQKLSGELTYALSGFLLQPSFSVHQLKNRYRYSYSFSAALRPEGESPPPLWMQIFTRYEPAFIEATAVEQYIFLPLIYAESGSQAGGRVSLFTGISLEGIYRKGYPEKTPEETGFDGVFALSSEQYELSLKYKSKDLKADITYTEYRGEGKLDSYYTGLSFSRLSVSQLMYKSWSGSASFLAQKQHLITARLSHYSARGRITGNIQTWPFSTFLISVFGNRINTIIRGSAELAAISVSDDIKTKQLRIVPQISYFDIRPGFTAETWQPAFLVFGIKDYKRNELIISRAGALLIATDFYRSYKSWEFSAGLGQLLPVYITKRPPAEPGAPPAAPGVQVKSDGGRWFNFSVNYNF